MKISNQKIALCGLFAGLYLLLYFSLTVNVGIIQFRMAESLTPLAALSPYVGLAVTVGCFAANIFGVSSGLNPMPLDIIFGSFATGFAAFLSWKFRKVRIKNYPILSALMPVVINAVVIGAEITLLETGTAAIVSPYLLIGNMGMIALSQVIPCLIIGPIIMRVLEKSGLEKLL